MAQLQQALELDLLLPFSTLGNPLPRLGYRDEHQAVGIALGDGSQCTALIGSGLSFGGRKWLRAVRRHHAIFRVLAWLGAAAAAAVEPILEPAKASHRPIPTYCRIRTDKLSWVGLRRNR